MKRFAPILLFLSATLAAGMFEDAERLFLQGKFKECDSLIGSALKAKPTDAQRVKLQAMREYIWGNDPEKVAENVKKAGEIARHRGWLTADLLNHSALLIRRAEDWKARGIPEYQDLSNAAAELLGQLKDGGNPAIAIRQVILQTRNDNLNGEYHEPIRLIQNLLRLYYPSRYRAQGKKSSGEIELLILLGEQYAGLGASTRDEREKIKTLSSAAQYYLQAVKHLPENSVRFPDLCDRLCLCRETLRLLGYHLQLPRRIKPRKSMELSMIDEMLRSRRFHDVVMALENKSEPSMRLRYATALSAIGKPDKAVAVIQELKEIPEPHFLLQMGKYAIAFADKEKAGVFFQRFLATAPQGQDAITANQQYAAILIEQKKYDEGANVLLQQAKLLPGQDQKENTLFLAAQYFYQAGRYSDCIRVLSEIPPTPPRKLLSAQAQIKNNDIRNAFLLLNELLKEKNLSAGLRNTAAKLAVFCSMKLDSPDTVRLLEEFLRQYPDDAESPEYARHLLTLYKTANANPVKFEKLATYFFRVAPMHHDTTAFLLACADRIPNAASRENIFRMLLNQKEMSAADLNVLLKKIPSLSLKREFWKRYHKPFENIPELCELYFQIAEIEFKLKNYRQTSAYLELLLQQTEVFQYKKCKKLQIESYVKLGRETDVRKSCQELLLTKLDTKEKRSIVLLLAQSWARSGESKKAIACAWTAVPLDGNKLDGNDERMIRDLLRIIIDEAKKIQSKIDLQEAEDVMKIYSRSSQG